MNKKINLRQLKKAKTKLLLLKTAKKHAGEEGLKELHIEDLCREAEVSKVTFFNYFSQKEELFNYYMAIWGFERAVDQLLKPLHGLDGLRRIFYRAADDASEHPGMFLSLIRFLASEASCPRVPALTEAERHVLTDGREVSETELPHLYEQFQHFTKEAQQTGEMRADVPVSHLVHLILTIFYGAFLTAHTCGISDRKAYYDMHLQLLLPPSQKPEGEADFSPYWNTTYGKNS
ncbi:TetR/AcrR family transcriptional regulator [Alteribacillus sp. HJP-4]|uniref:TetR/AcrR family transcriptional regulator n=1 Tax=Alteribacillus sp. HJP-4 TaxID=2775394 RepID=UPI0035CD3CC4